MDESSASRMARERKAALLQKMRGVSTMDARPAAAAIPVERPVPRFEDLPEYRQIRVQELAGELTQIGNPFYRMHDVGAGAETEIDGRRLANFASYDYAGANQHPSVHARVRVTVSPE